MDNHQSGQTPPKPNNKSVRWTGRDDHREHTVDRNHNDGGDDHNDYFTYANASGNRFNRRRQPSREVDFSSDSSTESDEDERDEDIANTRAATRANTWFNRLRQQDDDDVNVGSSDDDSESQPLTGPSRPSGHPGSSRPSGPSGHPGSSRHSDSSAQSSIPQIQVSEHPDVDPYAHIMDIGTKVSGGLAPGGTELSDEAANDPLDEEYRQRRDRMSASLGSHSQPTTPQDEIADPFNAGAIPLQTLAPPRTSENSTLEDDDPNDNSTGSTNDESSIPYNEQSAEQKTDGTDEIQPPKPAARRRPSLPIPAGRQTSAAEAEALRMKSERNQSERLKRTEEISANRRRRQHMRSNSSSTHKSSDSHASSHFGLHRQHSECHSTHTKDSDTQKEEDSEEEELRRLEEVSRQEAESHAKLLVKSHLGSNFSKPGDDNNGYVDNHRYLLDAGLMDDDIPLEDDHENESNNNTNGSKGPNEKHSHSGESDRSKSDASDETSNNEKSGNKTEDYSDTDSDSEDDNRNVSLRGDPDYVPPPKKVKEGVLGSLLRLYAGQEDDARSSTSADTATSPNDTPSSTPLQSPSYGITDNGSSVSPGEPQKDDNESISSSKKWKRPGNFRTYSSEDAFGRESRNRPKWFKRPSHNRTPSISHLASSGLAAAGGAAYSVASAAHSAPHNFARRAHKESDGKHEKKPFDELAAIREKEAKKSAKKAEQKRREKEKAVKKARLAEQARITVHIADVLQRQRFLLRLGRALMLFGAPSHRLEEYLKITSRVLELDVQVLYIPGCLLFSFGDATTHTSETKLLKVTQGLNLQKLHYTHSIYKEVVHDLMSLEEASSHIDHILRSKNIYPWWLVVIFYGLACVCCGMFAYGALWKDMPIIFVIGAGVGFSQFWVQPKSDLYANVFEVSSSIVVSFSGRAFGSIGHKQDIFCFSSIVQASISLILPGYIILVGASESQTKNLVAGSVRMFYANIYSSFLSFGVTLGSAIYGWIDRGAVTRTSCVTEIDPKWKILFVPTATSFMAAVNQAGPRQSPVMVLVGSAGYAVQYFVQQQVANASSFTSAIGAFTLGVSGNLYSRVGHGLAFAAMLPGIFVLVPSGVAAHGYIVQVATQIVNSTGQNSTSSDSNSDTATTSSISDSGNTMTQVAVGIVVGLFAATLVVYPLGFKKKRSGLFTF